MESIDKYVWYQEGPGVRKNQYTTSGVKLLNVANLVDGKIDLSTSDRYISEEEANGKYKHFLVNEGDLIIASSGIQVSYFDKKMGFAQKNHLPLCMNTSTIRFKTLDKDTTNIRYFMYFLKSKKFKNQIQKLITGSAQLNFGPSHLSKIKIEMPDIKKQNEIVCKLDKIQELLNIRKKQIEQFDDLIKSQFVEMFKGKNTPDYTKKIEELCSEMMIGPFGSALHKDEISTSGDVFVLGTDNAVENFFSKKEIRYIDNNKYQQLKKYTVKPDDIIISMMGTIGRTAVIPNNLEPAIISSHLCCLTPDKSKIYPDFLQKEFVLDDEVLYQIHSNKKGAIMSGLNLGIIKNITIHYPDLNKQKEFLNIVKQIDKQKFELEKSLVESHKLYEGLMEEHFG